MMSIRECKYGMPVCRDRENHELHNFISLHGESCRGQAEKRYGHIVGFDYNSTGEVIAMVRWAGGETTPTHLSNLAIV